ncbi:FecR family protein [Sphingomonas sp. KC8]|uniref:FecR family protein n=1 Tax=Sphingomonas sp. KC8 TaxID=1030157 RepID=UPI000248B248|nr:FecR domain-containing protein [Sphingomonas sp. KC8]ARS26974.1 hypothetical protein KC8_06680 [Sphingomonas sp. KC8]
MTSRDTGEQAQSARIDEATDWFARLHAPDADQVRAEFEAWRADLANARAYAAIEQVWAVTATGTVRGDQPPQPISLPPRSPWRRYALAATLAIVAIGLAFLLTGYGISSVRPVPAATRYVSDVGEIRTIDLADGSTVTLDTASRFEVDYSDRERRITLYSGRARFAVAHDAARPFIVSAQGKSIVARGTIFDVRIDQGAVEVTLLEGAVDVERRSAGAAPHRIARLVPGQRVKLDENASSAAVEPAGDSAREWPSGLLPAHGLPLSQLVEEANRYSRQKIVLADPALGSLRVSGAFRPGDAEALASKLSAALALSATERADGKILLARQQN